LRFVIQALCLETGGGKIMVDTCIGPRQLPEAYAGLSNEGSFIETLTAAGFGRDDVDLVICTHLHFDHVGWNTIGENSQWIPTFRKARYVVAKPDYEHWKAASGEEKASPNLPSCDDALLPLFDAGVVDLVEVDHRVSDAIRLVSTPGHTPGHVSVSITSQGESALITGDSAHHPVQLEEPGWFSLADADPGMSSATRRRLVREYADTSVLIVGTHFPPPTAGHLVTTQNGVRFLPVAPDPDGTVLRGGRELQGRPPMTLIPGSCILAVPPCGPLMLADGLSAIEHAVGVVFQLDHEEAGDRRIRSALRVGDRRRETSEGVVRRQVPQRTHHVLAGGGARGGKAFRGRPHPARPPAVLGRAGRNRASPVRVRRPIGGLRG